MMVTKDQPGTSRRTRRFSGYLRDRRVLGGLIFVLFVAVVGAQQLLDRSRPPALGPAPKLVLPSIQKRALSNGLPVWVVESHEVPVAQVNLVVLAGSGDDPPGKFGVGSLTAAMLDEGAGTRSSLEIADAIEFLGATLTTASSFDASGIRVNVPVARLQDAVAIMADVGLRPTFPQADLDRLRQERLTSLLQAQDDPDSIAATAFARLVFGRTHRYGTSPLGTEASLSALTVEDLRAFHAMHFVPSSAVLIVVGDVGADGVLPLLEQQFGAWKGPARTRALPPPAEQLEARQLVLVDKPGAAQSQIRIGWVGVARSTPDYFTIQVMNTVLGGSFTSRLNQNLREQHGYTYGASSAFDMRLSPGPFVAAASVQTDKTAEALREFMHEFNAIRKAVTEQELLKAKNYLALGFPGEFETTSDLSRRLEELIIYGLPENYLERYTANIQAVTTSEVLRVATTHLLPARMLILVVGDRKAIEPGIRALNAAPLRDMTVAEAFGK